MTQRAALTSLDDFQAWMARCRAYDDDPWRAGETLLNLAASVPPGLTVSQREVARSLLDAAWVRMVSRVVPIGPDDPEVPPAGRGHVDVRVVRALAEIDRRYADPTFRLRDLARQLAVSDCRLTQMLKQTTGRTFGAHLHARRIAAARSLLADASLSVKEIAARVGYATTTQLDRHFKKIVRSVPSDFRTGLARRSHRGVSSRVSC